MAPFRSSTGPLQPEAAIAILTGCLCPDLEQRVELTRQIVSLGRALRERHRLRTRQPLAKVIIVHHESAVCEAIRGQSAVIADELNVKEVEIRDEDSTLATLSFKANFKTLGRRLGKKMKTKMDKT